MPKSHPFYLRSSASIFILLALFFALNPKVSAAETPSVRTMADNVSTMVNEPITISVLDNDTADSNPITDFSTLEVCVQGASVSSICHLEANRSGNVQGETVNVTVSEEQDGGDGGDPNQSGNIPNAIQSLCNNTEDSDSNDYCALLSELSESDRLSAINSIQPNQVVVQHSAIINLARSQSKNLSARFRQLRSDSLGINLNGLVIHNESDQFSGEWLHAMYDSLDNSEPQRGGGAGDAEKMPIGIFVSGSIATGDKKSAQASRGYDLNSESLTVGFDYRIDEQWVTGLAYGHSQSDIEFNSNSDDLKNTIDHVYGYASWYDDHFYLDGVLGYAFGHTSTSRRIIIPGTLNTKAKGNTDSSQISVQLAGGYDFNFDAMRISPYLKLNLIDGEIKAYDEDNGGGFGVSFSEQKIESHLLTLGAEAQYALGSDWGVFLPYTNVEFQHELKDKRNAVAGHYLLDPTALEFTLMSDKKDSGWLKIMAGFSVIFPHGYSFYADYENIKNLDKFSLSSYSFGGHWEMAF
ncbi:MAG: autotransporter outer membrane beta-barrel domain-containing protein [Oleiphilus sp.]